MMTRKRVWEIGATALLLVAVAGNAAGFVAWRERQRRLDRELETLLREATTVSSAKCDRILSLLRQGASVHVRDEYGWTVLMEAVITNHQALLREALVRGAEVNAAGPGGYTPLMAAAYHGHRDNAALLIAHGADIHCRDASGTSVLTHARRRRRTGMVRLLKQHGAKE
jgi:ankyrin repeat protein